MYLAALSSLLKECGRGTTRYEIRQSVRVALLVEQSRTIAADQEAKRGSILTQSTVPMDYTTGCTTLTSHRNDIADGRYRSDPHS